ncbi:crotonase/enoyl-CoA hydratase family protein [Gammaproteobacteria bacterium]|nr:crotonase/enoyl-CoA hydratase family protein [Gammaproteobacteria bacterium]
MSSEIATLSQENNVSIIKLDDGKANAFSYEMLTRFNELLVEVPRDSGALIITGRDGLFSGGFDLKTLATGDMEKIQKMVTLGYKTLLDLYGFDRPIIAAVSGHSIALGLFVTCCADYRIAIDGQYICQANEVRNNMDIPIQIMEILKARVNKNYFYPAVYHSDAYSMKDSIAVGFIDEVVAEDKFMERVMEKAVELSTLPHPFYVKTKHFAQGDIMQKIADAIEKYEKLTTS